MEEGYCLFYQKKESNDGLESLPVKKLDRIVTTIVAVSSTPLFNAESKERRLNSSPHYNIINVVKSISKIDIE